MTSAALLAEGYLPTPGPMLQVVTRKKRELADRYDRYLLSPQPRRRREHTAEVVARARRQELAESANFLELCLVAAGLAEANSIIGATTLEELQTQGQRLIEVCGRITGLDPRPVLRRHERMLQVEQEKHPLEAFPVAGNVLAQMTQVARTVTAACPIDALEEWGHDLSAADLSHRCRKAYEGLVAFARRHHGHGLDKQMRTVGRAYAEGRLTLEDVSQILQVSPPAAVALLEKYSFCRPAEVISLKPTQRSERLRAIAGEVQASSKEVRPLPEDLLDRDVIASQRIEGVDAHPWLTNKKD